MIRELVDGYGRFVAKRPVVMLIVVVLMSFLALQGTGLLRTEPVDNRDALPEGIEVLEVFNLIESKFGGTESGNVVIELNDRGIGANKRDIRTPEVMEYVEILKKRLALIEDVISVDTITDYVTANGGTIPQSQGELISVLGDNPLTPSYIDPEYGMLLINMRLSPDYDYQELYREVISAIEDVKLKKPSYVDAKPSGSFAISVEVNALIGPDIGRTSSVSFIAIIVVVTLLFMSIRHSFIALMAIVFGLMWALGVIGIIGLPLTSITSGAISMTLGIGIDFGIQIVTRFRQELESKRDLEAVMEKTMSGVSIPMGTTTIAALIGFWAMGTGQLTIIRDLAGILSFGVVFSFLAALTVIPVLLVLNEKYLKGKRGKK
ncbi:MAG: MMPL family transporter [Candidatus Altiarchaeota archaeon]|nr:MMPL family transporter [Candidatus Altiarchaeota archaeon]